MICPNGCFLTLFKNNDILGNGNRSGWSVSDPFEEIPVQTLDNTFQIAIKKDLMEKKIGGSFRSKACCHCGVNFQFKHIEHIEAKSNFLYEPPSHHCVALFNYYHYSIIINYYQFSVQTY